MCSISAKVEYVPDLGSRLKSMRQRKGLSQKEVAARLSLNEKTIGRYEANTLNPSLPVFTELVHLYDTSADYLLGLDKEPALAMRGLTEEQQDIMLNTYRQFRNK